MASLKGKVFGIQESDQTSAAISGWSTDLRVFVSLSGVAEFKVHEKAGGKKKDE